MGYPTAKDMQKQQLLDLMSELDVEVVMDAVKDYCDENDLTESMINHIAEEYQ